MCTDLREPNKAVVTDSYPIPHMEELFSELMFSTIDLANAYYQIPLHEDSRDLTAFITHEGLFRYKRVFYRLASAPSAFQKMMSVVLQDLPGVQVYLDDNIVYSSCHADHETRLKAVLYRLQEAGLHLNTEKCKFY